MKSIGDVLFDYAIVFIASATFVAAFFGRFH